MGPLAVRGLTKRYGDPAEPPARFGKVIGTGLVGLLQLTIVGAAALVAVQVTNVAAIPALGVASPRSWPISSGSCSACALLRHCLCRGRLPRLAPGGGPGRRRADLDLPDRGVPAHVRRAAESEAAPWPRWRSMPCCRRSPPSSWPALPGPAAAAPQSQEHREPVPPGPRHPGIALGQYGNMVAQASSATRIMEILLATIQPSRLLAGKVIGRARRPPAAPIVGAASSRSTNVAPALGVDPGRWFLLGFLFYATACRGRLPRLAPGGGPGRRRADLDLPDRGVPAHVRRAANPSGPLATVGSLLPPFAPIVMAVRMADTDVRSAGGRAHRASSA
jgi:hypothetical protein